MVDLNGTLVLAAGDYRYNNLTVQGNAHLVGQGGLVPIRFTGDL